MIARMLAISYSALHSGAGSSAALKVFHHTAYQFLCVFNTFRHSLDIHRRFPELARALAVNSMLSHQHEGVGEQIECHRQSAALDTHGEFMALEFLTPFPVDRHCRFHFTRSGVNAASRALIRL